MQLALSCGGAIVSWLVVIGATGAAPITGGASLIITGLAVTGGVAGTAQCVNAGYRMYNEVYDPNANDDLDSQQWYSFATQALDVVDVVGGVASGAATIRMVQLLKRSTGKSALSVLKGLSRQERKRLTEELVRLHNPGISNQELKVLIRRGIYPQRYGNREVSQAIRKQLLDAAGATLGFTSLAASSQVGDGDDSGTSTDPLLIGVVDALQTF